MDRSRDENRLLHGYTRQEKSETDNRDTNQSMTGELGWTARPRGRTGIVSNVTCIIFKIRMHGTMEVLLYVENTIS